MIKIAKQAQEASRVLANISTEKKNKALLAMADALVKNAAHIKKANKKDISFARSIGKGSAFLERLYLDDRRIGKMADGLRQVAKLKDPVGDIIKKWKRPNGLLIKKVRVPIGVIGIIFESRPDVTADCAALCLKSGNAVILRGGKESIHSNIAIFETLKIAAAKCGLPSGSFNLIKRTEHEAVTFLLGLSDYIDLVIPRGGEALIREVVAHSKIPVIKHYKGVCHTYVDKDADLDLATEVCFNAKVQRPATCNAMEAMLVHEKIARDFLPPMISIFKEAGVEIRGCARTRKIVKDIKLAKESDWGTEFLSLILAVKVVKSLDEAIAHITKYGTKHSDAVITKNEKTAEEFLNRVDAACVYLNASTRFTDGNQFGMGAEIGISTDKIHARGPMALEELCSYKYVVLGNGQLRK